MGSIIYTIISSVRKKENFHSPPINRPGVRYWIVGDFV